MRMDSPKSISEKKHHKKPASGSKIPTANSSLPSTNNNFSILGQSTSKEIVLPIHSENILKSSTTIPSSGSQKDPKPSQTMTSPTSNPTKESESRLNGMEMVISYQEPNHPNDLLARSSEPKHMEEEPESINIRDLDIFGPCKRKEFDKIPNKQLESLEVILSQAHKQRTLGI